MPRETGDRGHVQQNVFAVRCFPRFFQEAPPAISSWSWYWSCQYFLKGRFFDTAGWMNGLKRPHTHTPFPKKKVLFAARPTDRHSRQDFPLAPSFPLMNRALFACCTFTELADWNFVCIGKTEWIILRKTNNISGITLMQRKNKKKSILPPSDAF